MGGNLQLTAIAIASTGMLLFTSTNSHSHDLTGILHDLTSNDVPESIKSFNRAYATEGDVRTRAVLVNAFIWPTPARLTVCFDKGPVDLRSKIASAMTAWSNLTAGNLTFVFSDQSGAKVGGPTQFKECDGVTHYNIRIGFVKGGGDWSQIGTLSDAVFPDDSMNLDFDSEPRPDDQTISEITKHETGHAVGFHHEHQSPGAPCTNWAWEKILTAYQWPGTTRQQKEQAMHQNLDRLNDYVLTTGQHAYTYTTYDRLSIMHYSFPATMFTDGSSDPCYVPQAQDLSPTDRQAMSDAYATQTKQGEKTRSIDLLLADDRFKEFRDLLTQQKQLYPGR
jgi:hypothetical protein